MIQHHSLCRNPSPQPGYPRDHRDDREQPRRVYVTTNDTQDSDLLVLGKYECYVQNRPRLTCAGNKGNDHTGCVHQGCKFPTGYRCPKNMGSVPVTLRTACRAHTCRNMTHNGHAAVARRRHAAGAVKETKLGTPTTKTRTIFTLVSPQPMSPNMQTNIAARWCCCCCCGA